MNQENSLTGEINPLQESISFRAESIISVEPDSYPPLPMSPISDNEEVIEFPKRLNSIPLRAESISDEKCLHGLHALRKENISKETEETNSQGDSSIYNRLLTWCFKLLN